MKNGLSIMRQAPTILGLLLLLLGCKKDADIKPGEVEATVRGYVIADNWGKGCSSGGLQVTVGNELYLSSTAEAAVYEGSDAKPVPVWIRFETDSPDTCIQFTDRIRILSIRKR